MSMKLTRDLFRLRQDFEELQKQFDLMKAELAEVRQGLGMDQPEQGWPEQAPEKPQEGCST